MDNTCDLTEGKVGKRLLDFFFPMLFTNLLQQLYSAADTMIVGKGLGDNALGAVGNLSSLSLLIIGFSMGMTNGFSVIIAQNYGSGNNSALRSSVALSVKLSVILTIFLTMLGCIFLKPILILMQTDNAIFRDSLIYGYIIFGGLAATVAYNLFSGLLRGLGDSKTQFTAIMIASAVNIALDCILIFFLHTGVEGAAAATVLSQSMSAFICLLKIRKMPEIRSSPHDRKKDVSLYWQLLKNGIPMALMNSVTAVGCMAVQGYVNGLGAAYTSAYSVCSKYLNLFMLPAVTAGFTLSAFVGQNSGAGKRARIRQGVRVSAAIALISYVILGSVMIFFPKALAGLMISGEEAISLAVRYLKICGAALFLVDLLFVFRSSVQGMGRPFIPMLSGIIEMALRIPAIIILLPKIGFEAAAWAEAVAWAGALTVNIIAYIKLLNCKRQED